MQFNPVARRRKWPKVLALLLITGLVGAGIWVVQFSSILEVRNISVRLEPGAGQRPILTDSQILGAAEIPFGVPLAAVEVNAAAGRISRLKPVAKVDIRREWPNTIVLQVTERKVDVIVNHAGKDWGVDREAVAFVELQTRPKGTIVVSATPGLEPAQLYPVVTVIRELPDKLSALIENVEARTTSSISLKLRGGKQVIWGTSDETPLKAQVALILLNQKGVRKVDVSAPGSPTVG